VVVCIKKSRDEIKYLDRFFSMQVFIPLIDQQQLVHKVNNVKPAIIQPKDVRKPVERI
jgi:hypothetical protein